MPRNIEIKARLDRLEPWLDKARAVADSGPDLIEQDDTFFACPSGRLKLRSFSQDAAELIFYQRPDSAGPKESTYFIAPVAAPDAMREVLTRAYGQLGRVRKQRYLFMAGRTRIHLDRVEGLGDFLELEVVLAEGESGEVGVEAANDLLAKLRVSKTNLIRGAYIDLLNTRPASGA